jgi:hypothetical protein
MLLFLLMQSAASPDIELRADVRAKTVTVEQHGRASLEVRADPEGGSLAKVDAPRASSTLHNVTILIDAMAVLRPMDSSAPTPLDADQVDNKTGRAK